MTWAHACDLFYGIVGLLIVTGVWVRTDDSTALLVGILMVLSYFAGSVKYRPR
jgi:hypothetical protein